METEESSCLDKDKEEATLPRLQEELHYIDHGWVMIEELKLSDSLETLAWFSPMQVVEDLESAKMLNSEDGTIDKSIKNLDSKDTES